MHKHSFSIDNGTNSREHVSQLNANRNSLTKVLKGRHKFSKLQFFNQTNFLQCFWANFVNIASYLTMVFNPTKDVCQVTTVRVWHFQVAILELNKFPAVFCKHSDHGVKFRERRLPWLSSANHTIVTYVGVRATLKIIRLQFFNPPPPLRMLFMWKLVYFYTSFHLSWHIIIIALCLSFLIMDKSRQLRNS